MKVLHRWRAFLPSLVIVSLAMGLLASSRGNATAAPRAGVSPDEKTTLLADHNAWRARYNSPALVWDDALATFADAWATQMANTGAFEHRTNNAYGENLWAGSAGGFPITDVTRNWGDEVNSYNLATNTCNPGAVCGHFTAVVWYTTQRVGCGKATAGGQDYVVCNYDPPGNMFGEIPFGPR
jgi:uncharacterized protein YkwD